MKRDANQTLEPSPQWYKDAVIYELHVRSFADSDGNGIGDFRGLSEKLDYLADLGVTAIWLLPFYPSPLKDDGYDIADYTDVNPTYGTLRDVRQFVRAAHQRGLRVITELVCNHTSDQHPWFQRARRARPGSPARNFYVWSDSTERYKDARIIFKDFEPSNWSWDPVAGANYWHRFFAHQPDLNFDNPQVQKALLKALDFWLDMGIDGVRLDAVPYLYEREGTSCENLPETHVFLKALRRHIDAKYQDRMLLAEANQWPDETVPYFGAGDECHMAFHFPLMPRLFMAIHMEDRFPIIEILRQTPSIPESCQWALFLRNHDELTLEMVTDEERDYMYQVYAQDPRARINLGIRRRLAPLLGNNRRKIELMNGLLFALPGTPVIYYGDEIGMGDNIYLGDRNGVRTPMQWNSDRNAGFSRTNPQQLYLPIILDPEYHYEACNVEAQQRNNHSLLWWMKRLIALRKRYLSFGRGVLEFLHPENRKVLAFFRRYQEERILVVANLSRFVQYAELDLSACRGHVPIELFGKVAFPPIGDPPYFLTLGPHSFYWFAVRPPRQPGSVLTAVQEELPVIPLPAINNPGALLLGAQRHLLEEALPLYLSRCRWFAGKARRPKGVLVQEAVAIPYADTVAYLSVVQVEYLDGLSEMYQIPLAYASGERALHLAKQAPGSIIARLRDRDTGEEGVLFDALFEPAFAAALLSAMRDRPRLRGAVGEVQFMPTRAFRALAGKQQMEPTSQRGEQSNSSVVYDERLILKLFRKLERGTNPEAEIGRFLLGTSFPHTAPLAGTFEHFVPQRQPMTLAIVHGYVASEGDAWGYTLDMLWHALERVLATAGLHPAEMPLHLPALLALAAAEPTEQATQAVGGYLESARLLGLRTAEMHMALARNPSDAATDPDFAPEAFTPFYQRSIYQSMRNMTTTALDVLRRARPNLPAPLHEQAEQILAREEQILRRFQRVHRNKIAAMRIRIHGDYHLGQVLFTGKDFVIIDFEGEPARPLSERRIKRSPLRDVAGMLRSFHYAAQTVVRRHVRPEDQRLAQGWARCFCAWVSAVYLRAYLSLAQEGPFLPRTPAELEILLSAYTLEKALYEVNYELNNRPDWVGIPLDGIQQLLGSPE